MIKLISFYPYDNNYDYTKLFNSKTEQNNFFNSFHSIEISDNEQGYIKEGSSFIIDINYDDLVSTGSNYVIWNNGYKDLYCFITSKEYIDEECSRINYEIDVLQTFLFDFTLDKSFIERKVCSLNEITEYDEGLEIGEHIIESENIVFTKQYITYAMFSGFKDFLIDEEKNVVIETPLVDTTNPTCFIGGIKYPLMMIALEDTQDFNYFDKYLANQPNLVGIIKMPNNGNVKTSVKIPILKMENNKIVKTEITCPNVCTHITSLNATGGSVTVSKNNITDFFPYTYYVLTDGESEPLIMQPQYLNSSITVKGKFALSHTPIERYYPNYYKGDVEGRLYNITNSSVMMLPTGTNGGLETLQANTHQIEQNKKSMYSNILMGVVAGGVGLATGGIGLALGGVAMATSLGSGINSIKENISRNKDIELTPSSIKSMGTPSSREEFNTNNVRIIKYTIQDKYKNRINNYIDRFGNKFNNYGTINLKTYKGYVKFISPNVDGKIDNQYINKIIQVLERGIKIE